MCDIEAFEPVTFKRQIFLYKLEKSDLLKRKYKGKRAPGRINKQIRRLQLKEPKNKMHIIGIPEKAILEVLGRPLENNAEFIWNRHPLKVTPFPKFVKVKI